jgi:hypothetical protein
MLRAHMEDAMTQVADNPATALIRLANGYQVSQAVHVAAVLRIADSVGAAPVAPADIAAKAGVDAAALYRLMRALATVGIFEEGDDRRFVATPMSDLLRGDQPRSLRGWPAFVGGNLHWDAWGDLIGSVKTGEDAFQRRFGESVWEVRAKDPERVAIFSAAMAALAGTSSTAIVDAFDFGRFDTIVDVGGADGTFLVEILGRNERPGGIVFDLPHVVAAAPDRIAAAGLAGRCTTVGGSYFEPIPGGADCYVSKSVLHDCTDEDCIRILANIREAMAPGGTVLIVDSVLGNPPTQPDAFSDLNMLVNTGGRERRLDEWHDLFDAGGFTLVGDTPTASRFHVLEGRPSA